MIVVSRSYFSTFGKRDVERKIVGENKMAQ
jgi:hypothetical protein